MAGDAALGWVEAQATAAGLTGVRFLDEAPADPAACAEGPAAAHLAQFEEELSAYLRGSRAPFSVQVQVSGTAFQRDVWDALGGLSHGATCSYGDLAADLGRPAAVRAVGAAVGRNPLLLVVPCHRVVGARGQLTGYAAGVARKRALLALERLVAAVPPLITERDGSGLLTLSPAELEGVVEALVQRGVRFDEVGPEAAGCAGPEVAVLRFPADRDLRELGAALAAAREVTP